MTHLHLRRAACLLAGLLLLAPVASAQYDSPFMQEFRKLMPLNADEEMAVLMRKNELPAILAVIEICDAIGRGSNDQLEDDIEALGRIWKRVHGTRFVDIQYNYFSVDLQGTFKKHRRDLIERYHSLRKEFEEAEKAKDTSKLLPLGDTFNAMGDQFAELGDGYQAGQCYRTYAVCNEDTLNGERADLRKACEGWSLFLQARETIDLKDTGYVQAKERHAKLVADGFDAPPAEPAEEGGATPGDAAAPAAAGATVPLGATFELVPDIEAIQRPQYTADSNFQVWATVSMGAIDSSAKIPTMEESPAILRTGANKAMVDVDGDGKGDVDIPMTGKITPVKFTLGQGAAAREWAFLTAIGQSQDTYQGFRYNLAPTDNVLILHIAPAASIVGTVNGVRVQVIDENLDGIYGSAPKGWGYSGLREGSFQEDADTVVIGESKVAQPWSRLQKIGDAWFEFEPSESGNDIFVAPASVKTGTLQLDMKGVTPGWVLVRGLGDEKDLVFDLVNGGTNKVEVPIGSYEIFSGRVASGKKDQMMKALIVPTKSPRAWKVGAGQTTKVELGAPFAFEFEFTQDEATVTVVGPSVVVSGRGGETYQRMWNCVPAPEVLMRKAGSTKGKETKRLRPVGSQEELESHKFDFNTAWFPVGEPIEKPIPGETFEVQLSEKKNKLFGKIESAWKAN